MVVQQGENEGQGLLSQPKNAASLRLVLSQVTNRAKSPLTRSSCAGEGNQERKRDNEVKTNTGKGMEIIRREWEMRACLKTSQE